MDPRGLTGTISPSPRGLDIGQNISGGATPQIGQPGKTMYMKPFDDYTRPMTRRDFIKFINDPDGMEESEKVLLLKVAGISFLSTVSAFAAGFYFSKFLPWKKFEAANLPKKYVPVARTFLGFGALSIAYILSQRWGLQQIMNLGEGSPLLFNTKRFLMSQRGNMMFARSEIKPITKEEMARNGGVGSTDARDITMQQPSPDGSINTEYSLSQEQFLPIAQTGYKPPPV